MATIKEQTLINQLAMEFESIDGITTTFGFTKNPDMLSESQLPAVVFVPVESDSLHKIHHNVHQNKIEIAGILFVKPRGNKLRFLENTAMPFLYKVRNKFQQSTVINRLLDLGLVQAELISGKYTAGGLFLTYNNIPYIGIIFRWAFKEIRKKNLWIVGWSQVGGDDAIS
jgi:hypothetical protein